MWQHGGPQLQKALIMDTWPHLVTIFPGFASFQTNTAGYVSNILHHLCKHAGGRYPEKGSFRLSQPFPCGSPVWVALAKGHPSCSRKESQEQTAQRSISISGSTE